MCLGFPLGLNPEFRSRLAIVKNWLYASNEEKKNLTYIPGKAKIDSTTYIRTVLEPGLDPLLASMLREVRIDNYSRGLRS